MACDAIYLFKIQDYLQIKTDELNEFTDFTKQNWNRWKEQNYCIDSFGNLKNILINY